MQLSILLQLIVLSLANDVPTYSFSLLALEWPPTNCMQLSCPSGYEYADFNIHGLWPSYNSGSGPFYCSQVPYSNTPTLERTMREHWRSDNPKGDESFWTHEWTKHGTCWKDNETPADFFNTVLTMWAKYNPKQTLNRAGYQPDNSRSFSKSAFEAAFSHKIQYRCYNKNGKSYLQSLWQCLDLNQNLTDCPVKQNQCGDQIYWPASSSEYFSYY